MGKKRKHNEANVAEPPRKDSDAPERPKRMLLSWKDLTPTETKETESSSPIFRNKEKVLVTCSRRISYRKQKDLYLWMAKCPNGPSVKFMVDVVHTMEELKLTRNHLKDHIFGTPKEHRKAKPYHDHVFAFSLADDHIWFRNYQISVPHNESDKVDRGGLDKITLVEVGPRFCLNPIKIFGGSFGGPTLYENPFYISPNEIRALKKRKAAGKYAKKGKPKIGRKYHLPNRVQGSIFERVSNVNHT
ncbi:hypothetical protein AAG906_011836 [Vitis piasezkii]